MAPRKWHVEGPGRAGARTLPALRDEQKMVGFALLRDLDPTTAILRLLIASARHGQLSLIAPE